MKSHNHSPHLLLSFTALIVIGFYALFLLTSPAQSSAQESPSTDVQAPSSEILNTPELYSKGEFLVRYKENYSPADIQSEVERRAQQAETILGRIRNTSENISLSLRGEEKPEVLMESIEAISDEFNALVAEPTAQESNTYAYAFEGVTSPQEAEAVVEAYKELPIEYIQPNYTYYLYRTPNDTDFPKQWGPTMINAPKMWDTHTTSPTIKVAIVDSGIDRNHPDLSQNVVKSAPIAPGCINDGDSNGHGTHVAGVIGATTNNSQGIAGITWDVDLYGYCVMSPNGTGSSLTISQGINQAVLDGADVINMSLGGPIGIGTDREVEDAIQNALDKNVTIVTSAGNCGNIPKGQYPNNPNCFWGNDADKYMPGSHPDTISVTALGPQNEHPTYANTGRSIDISAPGGNPSGGSSTCNPNGSDCIYSTWDRYKSCPVSGVPSGYCPLSGTSMATPHVTAIVAMIKSINKSLSPREVLNLINSSGHDLGNFNYDPIFGYGRVDAYKAVQLALGGVDPTPTLTTTPTTTTTPTISPTVTPGTPTPTLPPTCQEARMRGDYNCDGTINIVDFEMWRQDFEAGRSSLVEFEWFRSGFTTSGVGQ